MEFKTVRDFKNKVTRSQPVLPVGGYKTYEIDAPLATHWRQATCAEVECEHHLKGWVTTLLPGSDDESFVLKISAKLGIKHMPNPQKTPEGMLRYIFPPGQRCFRFMTHRVPLERDPLFTSWGGDWRGKTDEERKFIKAENWIDDFANHQDQIAKQIRKG